MSTLGSRETKITQNVEGVSYALKYLKYQLYQILMLSPIYTLCGVFTQNFFKLQEVPEILKSCKLYNTYFRYFTLKNRSNNNALKHPFRQIFSLFQVGHYEV